MTFLELFLGKLKSSGIRQSKNIKLKDNNHTIERVQSGNPIIILILWNKIYTMPIKHENVYSKQTRLKIASDRRHSFK